MSTFILNHIKHGLSSVFNDTSYRRIEVTKKDADTDWPLAGAEFALESQKLDGGRTVKRTLTTEKMMDAGIRTGTGIERTPAAAQGTL